MSVKKVVLEDNEGNVLHLASSADMIGFNPTPTGFDSGSVNVEKALGEIKGDMGGLTFYEDGTGKYVVGADSVPKKLGENILVSKFIYVGTADGATASSYTFDLKTVYPNNYGELRTDNFVLMFGSAKGYFRRTSGNSASDNINISAAPTKSYNQLTGQLVIAGLSASKGLDSSMGSANVYANVSVYCTVID